MALTDKLTAIGAAIREKGGTTELLTLEEMPVAIRAIETGGGSAELPEEAFLITGDCDYRFSHNSWNWFIDNYGNKVQTKDINSMLAMFTGSNRLENIPFTINVAANKEFDLSNMFYGCQDLKNPPTISGNIKPNKMSEMFSGCFNIRNFADGYGDNIDWSALEAITASYSGSQKGMFYNCHALREIPRGLIKSGNKNIGNSYAYINSGFNNCFVVNELIDLPLYFVSTWSGNAFVNTFTKNGRVKNITFATQEDGTPYTMNWKSQTIDLTSNIGYAQSMFYINNYNSGLTEETRVTDAASYAALKNNPDWFTTDINYSRYNHDSAVATINSLPDTSAYLASAGGTNTIKFKGASGALTDGGAINTLTDAEIAVAAAKGWTVSFS